MPVTLNPGFLLIGAALLVLAAPNGVRAPTMAAAALAALWLSLDRAFGASGGVAQMGLSVVPLNLDPLNQVFGIAFLAALVLIAIYSSARRNRYEDAAILVLAGGAVSALFVGDLVSFVAAAALAGLAAAWVVLASPVEGASGAGVRLLIWHGLEGLLFLVGVAFQLSGGAANSVISRLDVHTLSGGFIFAALMIRVGAPVAHVWLKDATSHASSAGAAALSSFTTMLGVYALARLFPAEPLLIPIGMGMIAIGAFFAVAEDDLRRAAAYGLMAQAGVCVALIGVGSPLALAAGEAHAFTIILAFALLQMASGAILFRTNSARVSHLPGMSRTMPLTSALLLIGGLAASCLPGFAPYVSLAAALEATAQWETRWIWLLTSAAPAALFIGLALRPTLAAHLPPAKPMRILEAPFTMLLGSVLAAFLCLAIGLAPGWLYQLTPAQLAFEPYDVHRLAPQAEALGAAGVAFLVLRMFGLVPKDRPMRLLDLDALYRGPVAGAGRWTGVVALRLYGAWQGAFAGGWRRLGIALARWARSWDRPYSDRLTAVTQFAAICGLLVIIILVRH